MNELSRLIKQVSVYNNPDVSYFDSFLPRYKMYRKAKVRRQKILVVFTLILVMLSSFIAFKAVNSDNIDIQTAAGIEHESK